MLRPAPRLLLRPSSTPLLSSFASRIASRAAPSRRFLSTAPPSQQSRSWKNYGARLILAGGVVYYYNTTDLFAEEPAFAHRSAEYESEPENLPTIDALAEQRKKQRALAAESNAAGNANLVAEGVEGAEGAEDTKPGSVEELEQEAGQEGAFNPETGEINWDCPCLGGMAHGPCGDEFKAAFSCFVFSEEETKGVDCIDKFQGMQTCFRQHPEIYGAELDEEDEYEASKEGGEDTPDITETVPDTQSPASTDEPTIKTTATRPKYTEGDKVAERQTPIPSSEDSNVQETRKRAKKVAKEVKEAQEVSESPAAVPKADHESS